jgi:hypothetical protein
MKNDVALDFAALTKAAPAALSIFDANLERDPYGSVALSDVFDRALHASLARKTGGVGSHLGLRISDSESKKP